MIQYFTTVSNQTYNCYLCSAIILDHTTLHCMTRPTLPLISYIMHVK